MSDKQSDLLFKEVDEDLRSERLTLLWKKFGKYIIAVAVSIILIVAGREAYESYRKSIQEGHSAAFENAIARIQNGEPADQVWAETMPQLGGGYAALARLREAAELLKKDNFTGAFSAYDNIRADAAVDPVVRDLALLLKGMAQMEYAKDYEAAQITLSAVATTESVWYHSAQEQLVLVDIVQGDINSALQRLNILISDAETPPTLRERNTDLRDFLERQLALSPAQHADEESDPQSNDEESDSQ